MAATTIGRRATTPVIAANLIVRRAARFSGSPADRSVIEIARRLGLPVLHQFGAASPAMDRIWIVTVTGGAANEVEDARPFRLGRTEPGLCSG